ncbi:hypothetical protein [Sphingomonas nostoxanthinifaciens]|uniref:hypothetical protein n=1 Tax=Sphingomonas nostoxanthinifaciens TaxID=2872652 RepID=UPI001CC1E3FC|nr:hypothetical protein [Sphingomonas nostoxanthinifaciens]UAK25127.1 hypothetical protein K8P63_02670 [Sphingomonas nostoxanthinifaciens]
MARMTFSHLVDPPRVVDGGILFTMDVHDLQRTVCITDAALARLAPDAPDDRARMRVVLTMVSTLVEIAGAKASSLEMPELIVIDAGDLPVT